jgi:site-specific DNA recombinase
MIYGRTSERKNPETEEKTIDCVDESEHIVARVEHLRILNDDLWNAVKQAQESRRVQTRPGRIEFWSTRRPKFLLSGLMRCAQCGSKYTMIARSYGCAARNRHTCDQSNLVRRADAELAVVRTLIKHLERSNILERCWVKARQVCFAGQATAEQDQRVIEDRINRLTKKLTRLVQAIEEGAGFSQVKERVGEIQTQLKDAKIELDRIGHIKTVKDDYPFRPEVIRELLSHLLLDPGAAAPKSAFRALIKEIAVIDLGDRTALDVKLSATGLMSRSTGEVQLPLSAMQIKLAERVGFEPTVRLHAQRFSRPPRSTTLAPLRRSGPQGGTGGRKRRGP